MWDGVGGGWGGWGKNKQEKKKKSLMEPYSIFDVHK